MRTPDVMIVNLEGTLTTRGRSKCGPSEYQCYAFRAPPAYARDVFAAAGVDVLNLANNHSYDFGQPGHEDTRQAIAESGLTAVGGPGEIAVLTVRGIRVAIVGFAPYGYAAPLSDTVQVKALVAEAASRADIVVVVVHAGAEGLSALHVKPVSERAFGEDRGNVMAFADTAIAAGADLVVGSGPHVVRGMEFRKGRLTAYSVGKLVGYGGAFYTAGTFAHAGLLMVTMDEHGGFVQGTLHSIHIDRQGIPHPDPAKSALRLMRTLSTQDFGPNAARIDAEGAIAPP